MSSRSDFDGIRALQFMAFSSVGVKCVFEGVSCESVHFNMYCIQKVS